MDKSACFELGYVEKTHGLEGAVLIKLDVDEPSSYIEMESVFVEINNKLVPFFIEDMEFSKSDKAIVWFEDVESIDAASELKGCKLFLPLKALPKLEEDQFYFHEIIGFDCEDVQLGPLGKIQAVYEAGHQDLMAVDYKGHEVLVPIVDHLLEKVDKSNQKILVNLPDGLLDVYIEESENED